MNVMGSSCVEEGGIKTDRKEMPSCDVKTLILWGFSSDEEPGK
jgi:hypothetical protein